ncbi:hypothetical protein D3C76_1774480 [compost metagenome]
MGLRQLILHEIVNQRADLVSVAAELFTDLDLILNGGQVGRDVVFILVKHAQQRLEQRAL